MQTEKVQFEVMVKKMYLMIFFFGKKKSAWCRKKLMTHLIGIENQNHMMMTK